MMFVCTLELVRATCGYSIVSLLMGFCFLFVCGLSITKRKKNPNIYMSRSEMI